MGSGGDTKERRGEDKEVTVNGETRQFPPTRHFVVAGNSLKPKTFLCDTSKALRTFTAQ